MNIFELFGTIAINNRDANSAISDTTTRAERAGSRIQKAFKNIGQATMKVAKPVVAGATAIGTAFVATIEKTRDYRTSMAQLEAAFKTHGYTVEDAKDTYKRLYAVLGETDQSVEASNQIAAMARNTEDLSKWVDICTGVYATFPDSLPIESLAEAANETSKTGQLTGSLADALNWAGINEEDFQKKLDACTTEQERQDLIMNTLYWTYKDAADNYKETGKGVMEANTAQEKLNEAMATLGAIGEPIMSSVKSWIADMVLASVPHLQSMITGFGDIVTKAGEAWQAIKDFCEQKIVDPITSTLETMGTGFENLITKANNAAGAVAAFFGIERSDYTPTQTTDEYFAPSSDYLGEYASGWGSDYSFDGSHASGLDYVPRDGYIARLHKGETVLNSAQASEWRGSTGKIEALLTQLINIMSAGQMITLDSGILAGQLAPAIDARLGTISARKGMGN